MAKPSGYKPEFCERVIQFMSAGLSFKAFAGELGVCRATLYKWVSANPEFKKAKSIAQAKCRFHWEKLGIENLHNKEFNTTLYIAIMNNMFWFRDNPRRKAEKIPGSFQDAASDLKALADIAKGMAND
jgi:hypothetical protein